MVCDQCTTFIGRECDNYCSRWPSMSWWTCGINMRLSSHNPPERLVEFITSPSLKVSAWEFEITTHVQPIIQFLLHITPIMGLGCFALHIVELGRCCLHQFPCPNHDILGKHGMLQQPSQVILYFGADRSPPKVCDLWSKCWRSVKENLDADWYMSLHQICPIFLKYFRTLAPWLSLYFRDWAACLWC
jgi:hypothetical protein